MNARDEILAAVRRAAPPRVEAFPGFQGTGHADLRAQFAKSVAAVGGTCVAVSGELEEALGALPGYAGAAKVASLVPGLRRANVALTAATDPHCLADLDFCVVPGELGIAENGAVWITNHGGIGRAAVFLAQHLGIVLGAGKLVHDMHDAYAQIAIPRPGFGLFISGPSKTADIEQSLVIGAHGARSCTVLLVD